MLKGDRATPYLVGFKGHESAKIFYADANARYPYRTAGLQSSEKEHSPHRSAQPDVFDFVDAAWPSL